MNLTLKRLNLTPNYTEGELYVNGVYFCKTLEDTNRDLNKNGQFDNNEKKIYGETCIPYGKYKVILSYSPKFKRELPEILEVPNFQGIRIHRGNYANTEIFIGEITEEEAKILGETFKI